MDSILGQNNEYLMRAVAKINPKELVYYEEDMDSIRKCFLVSDIYLHFSRAQLFLKTFSC